MPQKPPAPTQDNPNLPFVLFLAATAALGGLLFGFDIAIITGAGPFLERHLPVLTQWFANAIVVLLFPWVFSAVGKAATFGFLGTMCLVQAWFSRRFLPETKGRTLEEIEEFWNQPAAS